MNEDLERADRAYTQAIQDAVRSGNWYAVPPAAHAFRQARAAANVQGADK